MDTKWKKFSRSREAKTAAFIIVVLSFAGVITIFYNIVAVHRIAVSTAFERSYYSGQSFFRDCTEIVANLTEVCSKYKSEQYILNGGTINEVDLANEERRLYSSFTSNSKSYNPKLTDVENYQIFKTVYANQIANIKPDLIKRDLMQYRLILRNINKNPGIVYLVKTEYGEVSNGDIKYKEYFKSFPSYMVFDGAEQSTFPPEIKESPYINSITPRANLIGPEESVYLAFTGDYSNSRIANWQENKVLVANSLYYIAGLTFSMIMAFIFLVLRMQKKLDEEQPAKTSFVDRIYNDLKIILVIGLNLLWIALILDLSKFRNNGLAFTITLLFAVLILPLLLSLVKHFRNKTFLKHSSIYVVFNKLFSFVKNIYSSGSLAMKIVLIVIGYPVLAALTFFIFPITLGLAAWIALKRVKEFNAVKEGVKQVKEGAIEHIIDVPGDGELARLASDINSITDGLAKAVDNGIKSERLKSELITNVSHDIRTPLTSIITYVDLLKNEKEPARIEEYIEVIDQKAQRLKQLTDDLFEAAKASSGSIPVCFETIEIVSLLKQGLGEMDDRISERKLDFKLTPGQDKLYVYADGKLLWRAIENLFSNILKYALEGSRVYIDVIECGPSVQVVIKNISAYELNISAEELMERFTRGDESRSSQGSGLGLSIARSLLEIQQGSLHIEIDGDLFKAIVQIGKAG